MHCYVEELEFKSLASTEVWYVSQPFNYDFKNFSKVMKDISPHILKPEENRIHTHAKKTTLGIVWSS